MRGYGWQSAAAGGFGALAEILGMQIQRRDAEKREERARLDRATERRQDLTELQLREAGAGARNIADNARAERVAKMNIDAAEKRAADERQRKADLDKGRLRGAVRAAALNPRAPKDLLERFEKGEFDALDPNDVSTLFVTPYARDYDREDRQAAARDLANYKDGLRDGNQREPRVRPTEKAAFAEKMWNSHRATGRRADEFWDFLGELGAAEADEAARLGMTQNDYRAYLRKFRDKEEAAAKSQSGSKNAFTDDGSSPNTGSKKKSYQDILDG